MQRLAIKFAYDGRKFHGYARQPGLKTVEGTIIETLLNLDLIPNIKKSIFRSASRTDKGVSAIGNVIAFNTMLSSNSINNDIKNENILQKISDELKFIYIYGIKTVDPYFNPRHAKLRQYRYYLPKNNIDIDVIKSAIKLFIGKHDFSNFARIEAHRNPVRQINKIILKSEKNFFMIDFYAQNFLWHQIRRIISSIKQVGQGILKESQIAEALQNPDKKIDFGLAAAEPLLLVDVNYDFKFHYNPDLLNRAYALEENIKKNLLHHQKKIIN